jgi:hypothetical protein
MTRAKELPSSSVPNPFNLVVYRIIRDRLNSVFDVEWQEARTEWRRQHPKASTDGRYIVRILLDSRDLIEVAEHQRHVTTDAFNTFLRANNHELVLCASTVREICGPLAHGASFVDTIRPILQAIETLPLLYLKEVDIYGVELRAAVDAYSENSEYQPPSPYVRNYTDTLAGQALDGGLPMVGLRLDNIIYYQYVGPYRERIFGRRHEQLEMYRQLMIQERQLLDNRQYRARTHFANALKRNAERYQVPLPEDGAGFIRSVYLDARRCPGYRLNHEVFRALTLNRKDNPQAGDFTDYALISTIPYVDAITLDRRMRAYVEQASRKMSAVNATVDYRTRVYDDVGDLMRRL